VLAEAASAGFRHLERPRGAARPPRPDGREMTPAPGPVGASLLLERLTQQRIRAVRG
jgi:hypothetical protein